MPLLAMGLSVAAGAFLCLLGLVLLLNVFGLPGNWIMLGLVLLYWLLAPEHGGLTAWYWFLAVPVLAAGEAAEIGLLALQARRYGSSGGGTLAGLAGAVVGAVLMAPLFFGLGALLGALAGAWLGCYLAELARGRTGAEACRAALGCMTGRFLGTVCKLACGGVVLAVTAQCIWPDPASLPFSIPWVPAQPAPAEPGQGELDMVLLAGLCPFA